MLIKYSVFLVEGKQNILIFFKIIILFIVFIFIRNNFTSLDDLRLVNGLHLRDQEKSLQCSQSTTAYIKKNYC